MGEGKFRTMGRPKKTYPRLADCNVRGGLNLLADLAGMPRTNTYRAVKAGVYAVHKVDGFKQGYFTHVDSAHAAKEAWTAHVAKARSKNLKQFLWPRDL